jgi:predicted SnoaL-like aldol condensation-catalyzing enzyme
VHYEFVLNVIGQGNFVASLSRLWIDDRDHAGFNLFRLKGGKIVEHWDCIEEIAPREQWANSGKF